ncbi:MAG: RNA-guided pseudouridylation complex pseudouridine synthase subunit Cbf5 [Candidatus Bilamarchaeaceae archaeon]
MGACSIKGLLDSGVVVIDKAPGLVSHEVTALVKKILHAPRSGHAGTLDPDVSGVLPVALGRATKLLRYIAGKRKAYVGICKFRKALSPIEVELLFSRFTGEIEQTPPKISAVKKRKRKRFVYSLKALEVSGKRVLFRADVDAGTYIRTLCEDMGKAAGTEAFMEELRRVAVGSIHESSAHTMQELSDAYWLWKERGDETLLRKCIAPVDTLLEFRRVIVRKNVPESLASGAQLMAPGLVAAEPGIRKGENVSVYSEDGEFVGVGTALFGGEEMNMQKRGKIVKTERIHWKKAKE